MEFASLPFADYVFINPLRSGSVGGQLDQEWRRVYSDLGITVVGVGPDNPLLNEYRRRMDDVGGRVIASGIRPNSSTELVGIASSDHPRKWTINMKVFQERANLENQLAVVLGFPAGE
jgi:hypothetical protein